MEYKIAALNANGTLDSIVESLSEKEYENIMENIQRLQTFMLSKEYYTMIVDNIDDALNLIINPMDRSEFSKINRHVYNILGVFYAWIEYYENNLKEIFTPIKRKYYDEYFEYRMMYNLRTYMTHCKMGVTSIQADYDTKQLAVYIEPAELVKNSRIQKKIKSELQIMIDNNEKIELHELLSKFKSMFIKMHKELFKEIIKEAKVILERLGSYIRFEKEKALICNIYEKDSNRNIIYPLSSFIGLFLKNMSAPY